MRRAAPGTAAAWLLLALALASGPAAAHPLGNFSISHYAGIDIEADAIRVRYVIDMAEIPTFQEIQEHALVPEPGHATVTAWITRTAPALARGLHLSVAGRPLPLVAGPTEILFPPGAGDLPTLKVGVVYRAALDAETPATAELRYTDENFPDRLGWKEIVVRAGAGVTVLSSTAPATDRSRALSEYPSDLLDSPPQALQARATFTRGTAPAGAAPAPPRPEAVGLQPNREAPAGKALADLVTRREPGAGLVALALLVAVVLGAFHALEPGHGKTVVAAYLVGSRGTVRHALLLGIIVTVSHTAGVYLLGGVTFFASQHIVPERLYPWLSLGSGLTIAALGAVLFVRRFAGDRHDHQHAHPHHHDHPHEPDHHHDHHDHDARDGHAHPHAAPHDHGHHHHGHHHHHHGHHHHLPEGEPVSVRALLALGVSGGIIPCPAALVVLLSALSMHRVGFGLVLIVAFSVGLAAVLVAIGVLMVYAGRLMSRFREDGPWIGRWLPLTSSAVMTLLGIGIAAQALRSWIP